MVGKVLYVCVRLHGVVCALSARTIDNKVTVPWLRGVTDICELHTPQYSKHWSQRTFDLCSRVALSIFVYISTEYSIVGAFVCAESSMLLTARITGCWRTLQVL